MTFPHPRGARHGALRDAPIWRHGELFDKSEDSKHSSIELMNPSLRQFAAFVQVARLGSFARASEALGLSQPALSQSIAQMEAQLGARLFSRTTRALRLTEEGALLLPKAEAILVSVDEAMATVREHVRLDHESISLGALTSLAPVFLPEILRLFRERHPAAHVAVTDGTSEVLYAGVESGRIDLGIGSRLTGRSNVTFQAVLRERFALVLPRTHPLARKASVTWTEALQQDFIAFPPGSAGHAAMQGALARAGLALNPVMTFAQSITALNMVAGGAGVTALPVLGCPPPSHEVLAVRPLTDPVVEREVGLIHPTTRDASPALLALQGIATRCLAASRRAGVALQAPAHRRPHTPSAAPGSCSS
jgi:LysR family carnitine catabolism transcriptional activator